MILRYAAIAWFSLFLGMGNAMEAPEKTPTTYEIVKKTIADNLPFVLHGTTDIIAFTAPPGYEFITYPLRWGTGLFTVGWCFYTVRQYGGHDNLSKALAMGAHVLAGDIPFDFFNHVISNWQSLGLEAAPALLKTLSKFGFWTAAGVSVSAAVIYGDFAWKQAKEILSKKN